MNYVQQPLFITSKKSFCSKNFLLEYVASEVEIYFIKLLSYFLLTNHLLGL